MDGIVALIIVAMIVILLCYGIRVWAIVPSRLKWLHNKVRISFAPVCTDTSDTVFSEIQRIGETKETPAGDRNRL